MEQSRVLIAVILSFLVLLTWNYFFVEPIQPPPEPAVAEKSKEIATTAAPGEQAAAQQPPATATQQGPMPLESETAGGPEPRASRTITVETSLYKTTLSEAGAGITSYTLKNFREAARRDAPLKELISSDLKSQEFVVAIQGVESMSKGKPTSAVADFPQDRMELAGDKQTITFKQVASDGFVVEKTFTFYPDSYLIGLDVKMKNSANVSLSPTVTVSLDNAIGEEDSYGFVGPSMQIDGKLEQISRKKIKEKNRYEGKIGWFGVQDRYFISSLIPKDQDKGVVRLDMDESNRLASTYESQAQALSANSEKTLRYDIFMGPMSMAVLGKFDNGLSKAIDFGMFDVLAKPCLWLMNFIHDHVIHNYGVAIIILTVLIKLILWPLGSKSYKSMNQMKRLQPEMQKLREKYKDDKRKMNEELMQLYKTYKVNPMGGCLPMLVQIPVFFALYRMLYQAIELRHAPFFGWITDLSAPDRLFNFDFTIPMMQPPYGIPVLTLIMGGTMFLQQKMSPPVGDPTQAKMMMFMPIFFTFIFINFSSGLVLYWLVNNVISIGQQYFVQNRDA